MVTNKDIEQYKHLVFKIVNKYRDKTFKYKTYIDWIEAEQIGLIALYKALKYYDNTRNTSFISYASKAIIRALYKYINSEKSIESHVDIETLSDNGYELNDNILNLDILLKNINESSRNINIFIDYYYGGYNNKAELGKMYNISRERIRQIINRVTNKIKRRINANRI